MERKINVFFLVYLSVSVGIGILEFAFMNILVGVCIQARLAEIGNSNRIKTETVLIGTRPRFSEIRSEYWFQFEKNSATLYTHNLSLIHVKFHPNSKFKFHPNSKFPAPISIRKTSHRWTDFLLTET